ncbi:histidinol-phosphate transaminase [Fulvivirga sp. RKSG066]|uniref:histidinol-phosphate transaminase n=1 Tax=Fulvivirga aurantia TaxID=2529383 RepID=UPI0012BC8B64|nr:histidinol-phosphate transaminase [Fulvivirga aurantia]MTI23230.1 histidinol-phosphate transaminase [Fulvivirga aurantia]
MEIEKLVRPNILALKAYSSARDEYSSTGEAVLLDANENPYKSAVNRYPDPYQREVKSKLAEIKSVKPSQIFLGNGSDEAIDLIFRIFCEPGKDNIVITDPTYGMYEVSAGINNIEIIKAPLNTDFSLDPGAVLTAINENTKVVFLCSPNNPSGNLLDEAAIEKIADSFNGILVVDEAYIDFAGTASFAKNLDKYKQLIVLQTFSKAWGMAGVRLGMAFANQEIISLFNKVKPPYNINELTQQYALQQLSNPELIRKNIVQIIAERDKLKRELESLPSVDMVFPSDSNFLLVRFSNAKTLFDQLVEKKIIVRDRSKVRFGDNCLRITVGTPEENNLLIDTLKALQ